MPLPVIANVYRCSLVFNRVVGVKPVNVFHVRLAASSETAIGTKIVASLSSNMLRPMSSSFGIDHVTVLQLDGTSAGLDFPVTGVVGQTAGDIIPAGAALISLRTAVRGPRGRGRVYVGPICEAAQANGILDPTTVGAMTTAWSTFLGALNTGTTPMEPVIASYKHLNANLIVNSHCDSLIATQRRRQRQLT